MSLSDIEKEFFTRFNVPRTCCRKYLTACTRYGECPECSHYDQNFSQWPKEVTDAMIIDLITYLSRYRLVLVPDYACFKSREDLKKHILECAIKFLSSGNSTPMFYNRDILNIILRRAV